MSESTFILAEFSGSLPRFQKIAKGKMPILPLLGKRQGFPAIPETATAGH
jgi:hypothetical protein